MSEELLNIEKAKEEIGKQSVVLGDGDVMEFTISDVDTLTVERNGQKRRRFKYTGLYRKSTELEFKEGIWFSGVKFFGQLVSEAEKQGLSSLKGVTMKIKRVGTGLNTAYVIIDLIATGESPH